MVRGFAGAVKFIWWKEAASHDVKEPGNESHTVLAIIEHLNYWGGGGPLIQIEAHINFANAYDVTVWTI